MVNDPLAQFRRKPLGASVQPTPPKAGGEYLAFDTKDNVYRLKVRCANASTHSLCYPYLLNVIYDGLHGTNFVLIYTFIAVLVKGRNLQGVITALEMSTADFLQEYDPKRWEKPKDEKAPFIESMEIVAAVNGVLVSEDE
jgi:hypothetical protein